MIDLIPGDNHVLSNKLRRTLSSPMTDSITDYHVSEHSDDVEAKHMKFHSTRHKIIKVYIYILLYIHNFYFNKFLVRWFW